MFFELDLNAFRIDAKDGFLLNGDAEVLAAAPVVELIVAVPEMVDAAIDGCGT